MTSHGNKLDTLNASFCEVAADPGKMIRPTSLGGQIQQVIGFSDGSNLTGDFASTKQRGSGSA